MGQIAADLADVAIVTSDNPRSEEPLAIIQEILQGAGIERRGRSRPARGDRARGRARGAGRRRRDRRQGPRAGPGDRRRDAAVRRPASSRARRFGVRRDPDRCRGAARRSASVSSTAFGELDRPRDRLAARRARRPLRRDPRRARVRRRRARARRRATLVPHDEFAALAAIVGELLRGRSSARFVGITGSTGKTSTKDILAALCAPVARPSRPRGATTPSSACR